MTLEELFCKQECQDLIVRYFMLLDTGPRSKAVDLFSDDGKMIVPGGPAEGVPPGLLFGNLPQEFVPIHLATNIWITPTGPDTAEASTYVVAYNLFGKVDDALPRKMPPTPSRIGKIDFKFRKTAAGWRISQFKPNAAFIDDGLT